MDPSSSPENTPGDNEKQSPENKPRKLFGFPIIAIILALTLLSLFWVSPANYGTHVDYSYFWDELQKDNVAEVEIDGEVLKGTWRKEPLHWEQPKGADGAAGEPLYLEIKFNTVLPSTTLEDRELLPKLRERNVKFDPQAVTPNMGVQLLAWLAIPALFLGFFYLMMRRSSDPFGGGGMMGNFIKSPAKRFEASDQHTTFDDVAAMENAKLELQEIVEFLKNPARFQRLGAEIPKGVLLMGSPGTGKTLLARATAGEAGVPFYSINGSEFIQMFVGVGASRVRDLFRTAKENSPCILFVDEIDAVGRVRGAGVGGGHDEREQTLNQILSEMDGFEQSAAVIVLAATNRPDVLDPALLRPGRFDRHISVEKPAKAGREGILKVHCRKVPLADTVDLEKVAAGAVGFSGAELKNLVNEAALHATRAGKDRVDMEDFELARDRVIMGPRREEILSDLEKKMTAYHEAGHALIAWYLPSVDPVHKVTIIPRGRALGVTQLLPDEERYNIGESRLRDQLAMIMGGRAAEKLVFDEYSAGVEDDLKRATQTARRMVAHWGMSETIGPVAFRQAEEHPFLGREMQETREFSDETARVIDNEVQGILQSAANRATTMLQDNREKLDELALTLLEKESLDRPEIGEILGARESGNGSL